MFTIKQVANNLQISTQAIYKQKQDLIDKGYMIKNNNNQWEITDSGLNYLQDKKIMFMQQHTTNNIQPVANQPIKEDMKETEESTPKEETTTNIEVANLMINHYKEQLQTITNQLQEMTQQRDYFKAKFEEKDNLCNQYMNSHLLPPTEEETEQIKQDTKKKSFIDRLFNR